MPRKGEKQKQKLLHLVRILERETDDTHGITMPQLISRLALLGINADRKTLYQDIEELRDFGYDVICEHTGHHHYYHLGNRPFEYPEVKLLVDSVQSAKFITERKSRDLIKKLEQLTSSYNAEKLQRQVFMTGRVKTMNESVYYSVDTLQEAILEEKQVRFRYCQWTLDKQMLPRRDGASYQVSPWGMILDNENYYLVAYDAKAGCIRHYRVDKMRRIEILDAERDGKKAFRECSLPGYANTLFGMFAGPETEVTLEAENEMIGILIDRFGKDIPVRPLDGNHFSTVVSVSVSRHFFAWVMGLGEGIRIAGPENVLEQFRAEIRRLHADYCGKAPVSG